jgi:hypothetical protein
MEVAGFQKPSGYSGEEKDILPLSEFKILISLSAA